VNPITQAIGAAHAVAARAVADGVRPESLRYRVSDTDAPLPALDATLDELTGDELLLLAFAADVLAQRARVTEQARRNAAISAEIRSLKSKED
jgi:hypothetical protein